MSSPGTQKSASIQIKITEADVRAFAEISGDKNPIHLDADFAATTKFKRPIAHGMLTASYISRLLATEIPGPGSIYLAQTLNFRAPVFYETVLTVMAEVVSQDGRKVILRTTVTDDTGTLVLDGEATVLVSVGL